MDNLVIITITYHLVDEPTDNEISSFNNSVVGAIAEAELCPSAVTVDVISSRGTILSTSNLDIRRDEQRRDDGGD